VLATVEVEVAVGNEHHVEVEVAVGTEHQVEVEVGVEEEEVVLWPEC
jgi:hypothetical protein